LGEEYEMPVFAGLRRLQTDHNGIPGIIMVFQGLERCARNDNGAGENLTVREDL
jgi:hypothetical protein